MRVTTSMTGMVALVLAIALAGCDELPPALRSPPVVTAPPGGAPGPVPTTPPVAFPDPQRPVPESPEPEAPAPSAPESPTTREEGSPDDGARPGDLRFESTAEDGDADEWRVAQACCAHSFAVVDDTARAGSRSFRFELRASDPMQESGTYGGLKADLAGTAAELNQEHWYGFSMLVPADAADVPVKSLFFQLHAGQGGRDDGREGGGKPYFSLISSGGRLSTGSSHESVSNGGTDLGPVPKGRWVDYLVRTRFVTGSADDEIDLYMRQEGEADYRLVAQVRQGVGYEDAESGPYARIGIYDPERRDPEKRQQYGNTVVYFDEYREGRTRAAVALP